MAQPIIQPSLAGGEFSPALWSRVDLAKFHTAVALARNFFVDYRGGLSNRTGTAFVGRCKQAGSGLPPRNIPFTFSTVQAYTLEFGDQYMRVIMNGGYVLEPTVAISGATQANPCVVTANAHGYSNGDWVYIKGVSGMTQLNTKTFIVAGVTANTMQLTDLDGNNVNATAYGAYTSGGTVARLFTLSTPYAVADLSLLKFTQSADTMTLTHASYAPRNLTRSQHWVWTLTTISFVPTVATPAGGTAVPSAAGTTSYNYKVTAIGSNGITESLPSSTISTALSATMSATAGAQIVVSGWGAVSGAQYYKVYRQREVSAGSATAGELFGFIGTTTGTAFTDQNISPDFTTTPPQNFNPFASNNNPGCTTYYDGRQIFGSSSTGPLTLWASKSADFGNFDYSIPSRANDSVVASIQSQQVNAIKHLVPMHSLIALTASGAWRIDGGTQSDVITPSNLLAKPQAYNGCSDVPPIVVNYNILYVQSKGSIVRDLSYNFYVNIYTGADVTSLASHLFFGHTILEWAWAEEPFKIIWVVREDGVLLGFTYLKEQDVYAWTHHDSTNGLFKSVCAISEGQENAVYFVVQRVINGNLVYYQERLASRNMGAKPELGVPADLTKAWFVDCGLQYPLTNPNATLTPVSTGAAVNGILPMSIASVANIFGGTGYTAPTATVLDDAGTGSGAVLVPTVAGGVITGWTVSAGGTNYGRPRIVIADSTGSGAVAQAVLSNDVVMNASAPITVNVGDMVRVNNGWGTVRVVNSTTQFTVNIQQPLISTWPAAANAWSATTPVKTVSGLDHLLGQTVAILADGNVQPQQVVSTLSSGLIGVTLAEAASSILVGLSITGQVKSLYLDIPGEQPTPQGKRKRISAVTIRVQDTRGLAVRSVRAEEDAGSLISMPLVEFKERDFQAMGQAILPFTGDRRVVVDALWSVNGQLLFEQDNPLPSTILGLIPELSIGDTQ